ncbi:hypothetical protein TIFTF001_020452 [Ficus carica]|uniref:Uncharacterized protein n=1 Tax=Ficus carica TaxID=3494 RepID=A0AA88ADR2_FICCA|nr:hypothetical protein TIFTF001_020452 [Ficus carica]
MASIVGSIVTHGSAYYSGSTREFPSDSLVLTQPRPPTPAIDTPDREVVVLERWEKFQPKCYVPYSGLMNYKQKVGTPIKEHMMKIMAYLSKAQANGAEIDAATQLVMVFQTLFEDFDFFEASNNLNRKEMFLMELMKELQAFENIFKGSGFKAEANNWK